MNNFKKIGLTALAASLVSVSANAGELTASGSASITAEGYSGAIGNSGPTSWTMGNSVNFAGSTELDNGMTVSMAFELDQGTANNSGNNFDNHSVTIASDTLGTVKFSGHGGSSATSALAGTAAGGLWDNFDGKSFGLGTAGTISDALTSHGGGNNSFYYTSPAVMDGLAINASWNPAASAGVNSALGLGVTYTGVEGLSVSYATIDIEGHAATDEGDETALKASYAYGPVTVSYSQYDTDQGTAASSTDLEMTSYAISYTVSDELSLTYGTESSDAGDTAVDAEFTGFTVAYTAGGMTLTGKMIEAENVNHATTAGDDVDYWSLGASFAF
ncbi:porin [Pelagibacterales bacterium SAG-MED21]|nr:porin [Pelagibacterales bacterium SAG-MED21]